MKVFISWSGPKSKAFAKTLKEWLPQVINALDPWLSEEDVGKGRRWSPEIAAQLQASKAGIVCLTSANREAPWLLFEAGALSKTVLDAYVCPLLIDLAIADVTGPLAQFQATLLIEEEDVRRLVFTLNSALGDERIADDRLSKAFEKWWPDLKTAISKLPLDKQPPTPTRTSGDMIVEVLEAVRLLSRQMVERETIEKHELRARVQLLQLESDKLRQQEISYQMELQTLTGRAERLQETVLLLGRMLKPKAPLAQQEDSKLLKRIAKIQKKVAPQATVKTNINWGDVELKIAKGGKKKFLLLPKSTSDKNFEFAISEAIQELDRELN